MTEEETIAWLSRSRAPARREGALTLEEVAQAATAYLNNANALFEEALLLCAHEKIPRGAALTVLGLEELAKAPMLVNTFLRFEHGVDREAWQTYWKSGGWHRAKQELILSYGQLIRSLFDGDPVHSRYLYRYYAPDSVLENLDGFKQSNLYVDLRRDGVHAPSRDASTCNALDYLMTFGQERADSFASWHVTEARSRDYLELALGRASPAKWTAHHDLAEIRADILYQTAALSASQVPDYATFYVYAQEYRSNVPEQLFEEALLSLSELMRARVERSQSLSLFYARYLNAFKLLVGLSQQRKIVGADFGNQLREALLPGRSAAPTDTKAENRPRGTKVGPSVRKDKYPNFKALEAAEKRGKDYAIDSRRVDRSPVAIIAPHGGNIEPLTDSIANRIAGQDFSFYTFRGLKPGRRLHITSSLFDEPLCVDLLSAHDRALSIHGWSETGERVCVGGRDNKLVAALKAALVAAGIRVEDAAAGLRGAEPQNIVNRCRSTRGVQLELTMALRKNRKAIDAFVHAVRLTLKQLPQLDQK